MKTLETLKGLKERLGANGPGLTVAVVAMILALTGGAFAAGGALTAKQKKEVKNLVKAEVKKHPGRPGAPGAQGPAGPAGAKGDAGAAGTNGTNGTNGEPGEDGEDGKDGTSVTVDEIPLGEPLECESLGGALVLEEGGTSIEVCTGKTGKTGAEGICSSATTCVLPPGAVEMGTWAFSRSVEKITVEVEGKKEEVTVGDSEGILVPISFPIPLTGALAAAAVHYSTDANFATFCGGVAQAPEPINAKELCVYANPADGIAGTTFVGICKPASGLSGCSASSNGANKMGAVLSFSKPTGNAKGSGTFAIKG